MSNQSDIRALLDRQASDMAAGDAQAVMAGFSESPVLFDLPPPMQVDADAAGLQEWIDGWDRPPVVTYRDLEVEVAGDLAVAWGFVHTAVRRGGEDGGYWTRCTWVFRRGPDGWRITHNHTSVPFYMDDNQRAALDMEPGTGPAKISEG